MACRYTNRNSVVPWYIFSPEKNSTSKSAYIANHVQTFFLVNDEIMYNECIRLSIQRDSVIGRLTGLMPGKWAKKECIRLTAIRVSDNILTSPDTSYNHHVVASWWKIYGKSKTRVRDITIRASEPDTVVEWHMSQSEGDYSVLSILPGDLSIRFDFFIKDGRFLVELSKTSYRKDTKQLFASKVGNEESPCLETIEQLVEEYVVDMLRTFFAIPNSDEDGRGESWVEDPSLIVHSGMSVAVSVEYALQEENKYVKDMIPESSAYRVRKEKGIDVIAVTTMPPVPDAIMAMIVHRSEDNNNNNNAAGGEGAIKTIVNNRPQIYKKGVYIETVLKTKDVICNPVGVPWHQFRDRVIQAVSESVRFVDKMHKKGDDATDGANDEFADVLLRKPAALSSPPKTRKETPDYNASMPNLAYLQLADPKLFQYSTKARRMYSTICQQHRQPVRMTKEEAADWAERRDDVPIPHGSTPQLASKNVYACPDVWCPVSRKAMTFEEFNDAGEKCPGDDPKVKPFVRNKKWYVRLMDSSSHPDGLLMPCCFKKPGKGELAVPTGARREDIDAWVKHVEGQKYVTRSTNDYANELALLPPALHFMFNGQTKCGHRFDGSGNLKGKSCVMRHLIPDNILDQITAKTEQGKQQPSISGGAIALEDVIRSVREFHVWGSGSSISDEDVSKKDVRSFWKDCPEYVSKVLPAGKPIDGNGPDAWREKMIVYALGGSSHDSVRGRSGPLTINFTLETEKDGNAYIDERDVCSILKASMRSDAGGDKFFIATTLVLIPEKSGTISKRHLLLKKTPSSVDWKMPIFKGNTNEITPFVKFLRDEAATHVQTVLNILLFAGGGGSSHISSDVEAIVIDFDMNAYAAILEPSHALVWFPRITTLDEELLASAPKLVYLDDLSSYMHTRCSDADVRKHQRDITAFVDSERGVGLEPLYTDSEGLMYMMIEKFKVPIPRSRSGLLEPLSRALWTFTLRDHVRVMKFRTKNATEECNYGTDPQRDRKVSRERVLSKLLGSARMRDEVWSTLTDLRQMHSPLPQWSKSVIIKDALGIEDSDASEMESILKII